MFLGIYLLINEIKNKNFKIICSLSFLPMPLDKFSSTFDLVEMMKGFFPHLFNSRANQNYVGKYAPKEDYQPKFMTLKKRQQFDDWYTKISVDKNGLPTIFDF